MVRRAPEFSQHPQANPGGKRRRAWRSQVRLEAPAESTVLIPEVRQFSQHTSRGGSLKPMFEQRTLQWPGLRHKESTCTPKRLTTQLLHMT
jgi:hypothetical protein